MPRKARTPNGEVPPAPRQLEKPRRKPGPVKLDDVENMVRWLLDSHRYTPWFDTEAAAAYLRREPGTLKGWRSKGEGPKFHTVNDKFIRYHLDDLDAYVRGK
jgi:hypothetical protein